jgi:hypothetical protein
VKGELEVDPIDLRQAIGAKLRDFRLQPTRFNHGAPVNGRFAPTPPTIELDRGQVVVRGDEPQPAAACSTRDLLNFTEQSCAHTAACLGGEKSNHFTLRSADVVEKKPGRFARLPREEPRLAVGMVQYASGDNSRGSKVLGKDLADPGLISLDYPSNFHRCPVAGA